MTRRTFLSVIAVVSATATPRRSFAGPVTVDAAGDQVQTVARGQLPDFAGSDTPGIRRLYRYAVEHGEELRYIPCTCGCARIGHTSNRDCYIKRSHADGSTTFTSHAAT